MMDRKEEDLLKNQALERKALPKRIRQEMKAREMMFRESLRISVTNLHEIMKPTEEKDRLKKVRRGIYLAGSYFQLDSASCQASIQRRQIYFFIISHLK